MAPYMTKKFSAVERYADQKLLHYQHLDDDVVLTREQAARANNKSVLWMKARFMQGNGPAWFKGNGRCESYTMGALRAWWRELAANPNRQKATMVYPELPLHLEDEGS